MKIVYVGTRPQVNGATKVAITHCNILHRLGHQIRLAVLGSNSLDWGNPLMQVEYLTSLRRMKIDEKELIVALDCFVANWLVHQYGSQRVVSFIQTDEPSLYTDPELIKTAKNGFMLPNPKIVVSKYLQDVLQGYGSDSYIIAPAINEKIFYPIERSAPEAGKPFKILIIGSYEHPLKQIPQAFTVLEYLKSLGVDVRLVRLVRKAEDITPKDIETQWYVNPHQEAIGEIYRSVDALLFPSSSEGFGLPILEAMASGIPFVATDSGGSRDLMPVSGQEALICVGDTKAMGNALYQLATNQDYWWNLRDLGLNRAKHWSWGETSTILEEYLKCIYDTVF